MAPKSEQAKTVVDQLTEAANQVAQAMTAPDSTDPQIQQILGGLQQMLVQVIHGVRQQQAQKAAQGAGAAAGQAAGGDQGQTMSAAPGQQGYGSPAVSGNEMAMASGGGAGGGSPDELSRVLGPVGSGQPQ